MSVEFAPTDTSTHTGEVTFETTIPGHAQHKVPLTGTGVESGLRVEPNPLQLGDVLVGETGTGTLQAENSGDGPLLVTGVSISGAGFAVGENECVIKLLEPGEQCTVEVELVPPEVGAYQGQLVFHTDLFVTPDRAVALSGSGVAPIFDATPSALDFGSVTIPGSADRTVTVTNNGDADLVISAVSPSGPGFSLGQNGCVATLAPDESCTVSVAFSPAAPGPSQGAVTFATNVPGQPNQTVGTSGTGVAQPTPPGPPPEPPVPDIETKRAQVSPTGTVALPVDCTAPAGELCQGTLELRSARALRVTPAARKPAPRRIRRGASLASRRYAVPGGRTARIRLKLNRMGREALSNVARLRVMTVTTPVGGSPVPGETIVLRASRAPALVLRQVRDRAKGVRLGVVCRARKTERCVGTVALVRGDHRLAVRHVKVRGQRKATVTLTPRGRACGRGSETRHLRVRVLAVSTIRVGLDTRRSRTVTIRC